jgi:hypothetical protein
MSNTTLNIIPQHIISEYPLFVDFIKSYYEYLQSTGNAQEFIHNLTEYSDIDLTIDSFLKYFKKELMKDIPHDVLCDERMLLKHIKELYTSKGSEASYRFLFRALYNKEISFIIPSDSILRPSDGNWVQEYSICVQIPQTTPIGDIFSSIDNTIKITDNDGKIIFGTVASIKQLFPPSELINDGNHYLEFKLINNLKTINDLKTLV